MPISFYIIYHTAHYTVLELMLAFSVSTFYRNLRTTCRVCAISWIYLVQYLSRPFEQRLRLHISASLQRNFAFKLSRELAARLPTRMAVRHALQNKAFCAYEVSVSYKIEKMFLADQSRVSLYFLLIWNISFFFFLTCTGSNSMRNRCAF